MSDLLTEDGKSVETLLKRKKSALYLMTAWFWFEHIFIILYLAVGENRVSIPVVVSYVLTAYWAFFGWRYLPPKVETWELKYKYKWQFVACVVLEFAYVAICSVMGSNGIRTTIEMWDEITWYVVFSYIGNSLGLLSLIVLLYLLFLSFKIYKMVYKNDDIAEPSAPVGDSSPRQEPQV